MGGARNSAAQTGAQAFDRARASAKLADSKTLAATDAVASSPLETLGRGDGWAGQPAGRWTALRPMGAGLDGRRTPR